MIQVLGHKAPDTDSTGSPLIWAWYLSDVRKQPAKAVLQGTPNTEAIWMLGKWGVDLPEVISDVAAGDQLVIVDTNNPAELPASLDQAEVMALEPGLEPKVAQIGLHQPESGFVRCPRGLAQFYADGALARGARHLRQRVRQHWHLHLEQGRGDGGAKQVAVALIVRVRHQRYTRGE